MYVLFDLENINDYKSDNLQTLRNFADRHFQIRIDWWKLGTGAKVVFSDCGKYSVETCKDDLKGIHLIQSIANDTDPLEKQN